MGQSLRIIAFFGTLATACAGQNTQLVSQNDKLAVEVEQLRTDARRDRMRARDLEKRLALERAKKNSEFRTQVASERPDLPVEVRAPSEVASSVEVHPPATLYSENDLPEDYEIVGVDSEGVEIVYVGDAASDKVIKITARSFNDGRNDYEDDAGYGRTNPSRPSLRSSRLPSRAGLGQTREPNVGTVPPATDRLSVQGGAVPTIASQLRQARQPAISRTRPRSFSDPRAEYRRYYEALRAGNHSYAVTGFRNFVERFPVHDFADNAQYWLGEAFYDQKRYKSALVEFRKVVDNHPQGNKVPDALLKLGYCYYQNGDIDDARQVWQQVIRVYPKSNPASLAKTKLSEIEE